MSREGRVKLFTNIHISLRLNADALRSNPTLRSPDDPSLFLFDLLLLDGGVMHRFQFTVNDSGAESGVLRVVGVEAEMGG